MRFLLLPLLFTFIATANMDIYPKKECELFNNLKHTKNRGHEVLKLDRPYEMLKHHKEQYLVKVKGATPPQRWVDDDCLSLRPLRGTPVYEAMHTQTVKPTVKKTVIVEDELKHADKKIAKKPQHSSKKEKISFKQNLLALSWHNAFCETHRYKKECKRGLGSLIRLKPSEKSFVLHGLWPQPRHNVYCNVSSNDKYLDKNKKWYTLKNLGLSSSTKSALKSVMPGFNSNLHKHEWIKHGTCYGTNADQYYTDAISLVKQVNSSDLGKFFSKNIGKKITLRQVQTLADKSFGRGAGNRIALQCNRGLVTELWLYLGSGSDDLATLLKRGKSTRSRCKGGRIDKAGYGR
ncbi:Ribonuclease I precursor [hydrothermal vent metagenome]|uniref:Ribonuclease I n=1 Tax=hydrothermal vent metagenome TaxID=652676 RepID=A0A1W1CXA2_9ZZZZ